MSDAGKGDRNRTRNFEAYRENYDAIDWGRGATLEHVVRESNFIIGPVVAGSVVGHGASSAAPCPACDMYTAYLGVPTGQQIKCWNCGAEYVPWPPDLTTS